MHRTRRYAPVSLRHNCGAPAAGRGTGCLLGRRHRFRPRCRREENQVAVAEHQKEYGQDDQEPLQVDQRLDEGADEGGKHLVQHTHKV
eukprot:7332191-Prymnesium_polylepis.2